MITSAAVKFTLTNGEEVIVPCHRHGDAFEILKMFHIDRVRWKDVQGFIKCVTDPNDPFDTSHETFVDRVEAYKHAVECGQVKHPMAEYDAAHELYSEDLW